MKESIIVFSVLFLVINLDIVYRYDRRNIWEEFELNVNFENVYFESVIFVLHYISIALVIFCIIVIANNGIT